jgi:DNA-binding response OmpR family regulator
VDPKARKTLSMRILLIEDDPMFGKALVCALKDAGMAPDWVRNGADGDIALKRDTYGLVLLDLGLPGRDGLELLRERRAAGDTTPLLIVTARERLDDRVNGLDLGADDYLTKPFEIRELLARMRAVIRRRRTGYAASVLTNGDIELDLDSHLVMFRGASHVLSAREFALMRALMERPGAILSRNQIEGHVYGWGDKVESNAVAFLIHSVRRKLGKNIIRNVRGIGWVIEKTSH